MGVSESSYYEVYKHLNAKIIKPAVAEVNKTSNIVVTPETRKVGRSVSEIRFKIAENPQLSILDLDDGGGLRNSDIYKRMRALGVSDRLALQWMNEHDESYVRKQVDYVAGQGGVKNPVSYLTAALKQDFSGSTVSPRNQQQQPPLSEKGAERAKRLEILQKLVGARSPTQRDADRRLFMSKLDGAALLDFENYGWVSSLNHAAIVTFWQDIAPGAFEVAE
jgi:hypothetical protein